MHGKSLVAVARDKRGASARWGTSSTAFRSRATSDRWGDGVQSRHRRDVLRALRWLQRGGNQRGDPCGAQSRFLRGRTSLRVQRARVFFRFKALLEKHTDELARLITLEHGKVLVGRAR